MDFKINLMVTIGETVGGEGKIGRVGNVINKDNRTFKIQVDVKNNKKQLIPNMIAIVKIRDFEADSAVVVKILGETKPIKQWDVTGELRKRLKIAFDEEGIEFPFPQRVVHQAKD